MAASCSPDCLILVRDVPADAAQRLRKSLARRGSDAGPDGDMTSDFLSVFVPASLALNFYPGPNNIFALSNAARHDLGTSVFASLGRQAAYAGLIVSLALGLGALVVASPLVYRGLALAGAVFLGWLGVRMLRRTTRPQVPGSRALAAPDRVQLCRDEFTVAFANPKPLIVLVPFLPGLIAPGEITSSAVLAAGTLFLGLEAVAALTYGVAGRRFGWMATSVEGRRWLDRAGGVSVILAGLLLARTALTA